MAFALRGQSALDEGLWQGYAGEWGYSSRQLVALAEAIPAEQYGWRLAPGVRSVAGVLMHIAQANYGLLASAGGKMPAELNVAETKLPEGKAEVVEWLKRSQEAVRVARAAAQPAELQRKVTIYGRPATVEGIYLRILVHAHEHMGQLVAYARSMGVVPPWSKK